MKPIHFFGVLLASCALQAQTLNQAVVTATPSSVNYLIGQQDANSRVWQKITQTVNSDGNIVLQTNQAYVELSTGLNFWRNGRWNASKEEIDISPDASSAAATNGQHQVYFPGDIYSGVIKLITPDGQPLESQPIGLALSDGSNSVLLARVTNSTGAILPSGNQVIYTNAFAGLNADLLYTYTKAGFSQDVIMRQQPPDPASLGLNSAQTRLQVLTEFITAPQPSVTAITVPSGAGNLENDTLNFGTMRMGRGKAFLLGTNSLSVSVEKRWITLNGRQFLIEEVPIVSIASAIDSLAPFVSQAGKGTKPVISKNLILPPPRLVRNVPKTRFLAQAITPTHGFVLDFYNTDVYSGGDFTFGGTTYYVSGEFDVSGNLTIEGGTVIKFDESASYQNGGIVPLYGVNVRTSPYRPAILTSIYDNSVGETISSGTPSRYNCSALDFDVSPTLNGPLEYLYIRYAAVGIAYGDVTCTPLRHCQFVNVGDGIQNFDSGSMQVENVLFSGVSGHALNSYFGSFVAANLTVHGVSNLVAAGTTLSVTNSLFIGSCVTNWGGSFTGAYNYTNSSDSGIFQTVGAGNHYLAASCPTGIRNVGTTNVDPVLLADLETKTTYPPMLLTNQTIATSTTLTPQVQRRSDQPDLGYHYDPLDYIADLCAITNAMLTLTNGVAIATCNEAGIELQDGSSLTSIGSPLYPNWLVRYQSVQEGTNLLGSPNPRSGMTILPAYMNAMPSARFQFTKFACQVGLGTNLYDCYPSAYSNLTVQECEFWGGANNFTGNTNTVTVLNNNLFAESSFIASLPGSTLNINDSLALTNNLFYSLQFTFYPRGNSNHWSVFNNAFDSGGMIQLPLQNSVNGYNAYLNNGNRLRPTNTFDIVSATGLSYQPGPFGTFYQSTNLLIYKGSTNANLIGLYHYTVTTNEVVDGTGHVSIGYHYVATDSNGNPLDNNNDGIPDYIEDANGNGSVDSGEIGWNIVGDLGLKVLITRPLSGSILP